MSYQTVSEPGTFTWSEAAEILGVGKNRLLNELRRQGVIGTYESSWYRTRPDFQYDRFFKPKKQLTSSGVHRVSHQVTVTPEGLGFLWDRLSLPESELRPGRRRPIVIVGAA